VRRLAVLLTVSSLVWLPAAWAGETATPGPSPSGGSGLAAKYPGDEGLGKDPAVIFAENFEGSDFSKWDDSDPNKPPEVQLVSDKDRVHSGKQAAQLQVEPGKGVGGDLTKLFMPGYDQVYARWYCRFAPDFDQGNLMHFVHLAGLKNRWELGKSGEKPNGDDRFSTGLEPWRNWGRHPADPPVLIERGQWYCMEMMVKCNTVGQADGEQAFWIDGQLKGRYPAIRWRTVPDLKVNCLWVLLYIHENKQTNSACFDDVVVAKDYIGPLVPATAKEPPAPAQ